MNTREMAYVALKTALYLDPSLSKSASSKYPKDLGSWGLEESKLDELKRHLSKLKVELKVFDLNEEEFPGLKGKNLVELELRSDAANGKKVVDVLKRIKAFPIEQHHITNVKQKKTSDEEEYPTGDGKGYDIEVDNQEYVEEILHGSSNYLSMEEIHDIIGYDSYGVHWNSVVLSQDKKEIVASGIFGKSKIIIKVKRNDKQPFQDYELSWVKNLRT
jgi:hypothetical protein